jgi:hypothetical protein
MHDLQLHPMVFAAPPDNLCSTVRLPANGGTNTYSLQHRQPQFVAPPAVVGSTHSHHLQYSSSPPVEHAPFAAPTIAIGSTTSNHLP